MKKIYFRIIFLTIILLSIVFGLYAQSGLQPHLVSSSQTIVQSEKEIIITVIKNDIVIQTQQPEEIILYNTLGKEIFRGYSKVGEGTIKIKTPGIYLIKVGNTAKKIAIKDFTNH